MKLIENYFDEQTMSVHLKAGNKAFAKKGRPGEISFEALSKKDLTEEEVDKIAKEIEVYGENFGYFDQQKIGVSVLQVDHYRITITRFPLAEKTEITIVKPVKKLGIEDYKIDEKLKRRFLEKAEGILVAGAPGSGKSTFIQALINFYFQNSKVIKTLESPRDLQVPPSVTQYSLKHAEHDTIRDILLLSRPDYVFFDEIRNQKDFGFYSDLRLSGVGMVGIVHATQAIDAIQRFVGKLELGMIPSVIDTVVFIKNGAIEKVLTLKYEIKCPRGMQERDLSRPVISVSDFATEQEEYEIYTFGEETVVMPINDSEEEKTILDSFAQKEMENYLASLGYTASVEIKNPKKILVKLPRNQKAKFIGTGGENITKLEKTLGLGIDVREADEDFTTSAKVKFKKKKKRK